MTQAVVVMDVQNGIVARVADQASTLLDTLADVVENARRHAMPVIFVRVAFRRGAPEVSARNQAFRTLASSPNWDENGEATQIHPRVTPREGDIVVTKRRVSAFAGSDLDVVLRALDVDHLVLTGIATSGVVLSTVRYAADLDFRLTVISDACADADPEVHQVLMQKVFPRQATVLTAAEWMAGR